MSDVQAVPETETTAKPSSAECRLRNRPQPRAQKRLRRRRLPLKVPRHRRRPLQRLRPPRRRNRAGKGGTRHRRALVNLGTPDAPDAKAVRRYLKQFLTDPRVIEKRGLFWKLILNGVILPIRSRRKARDYQANLEQRQERVAVQDHHAVAGRKARRHPGAARQARHRRLGDALRQSVDRLAARGADRARLRPHSGHAALSAIRGGDHGDGRRRGVPLSDGDCAGSRRCASCRPITTIRITSRCWRRRSRPSSRRCRSRPM